MKTYKRIAALVMALLIGVTLAPAGAFAAGPIDLSRELKLSVQYMDGETALSGANFDLYLVAESDVNGKLTATEEFAGFNVKIEGRDDEGWRTLASTLEGFVLKNGLAPLDSSKVGSDGLARFPGEGKTLKAGLYLVLGQRHVQNGYRYDPSRFMVMLPATNMEENSLVYDLNVEAKFDATVISEPKPPVTPGVDPTVTTIDRKVLKVWEDEDYTEFRPPLVTIYLLRDGEVFDTVELKESNNWRHTWKNLDDSYSWTVTEEELADYTVEVELEGITFVVTNTILEDILDEETPQGEAPEGMKPGRPGGDGDELLELPDEEVPLAPALPQTGVLWWPVMPLACLGLLLIAAGLGLRRREESDEA